MEAEKTNNEVEVSAPSLADPIVAGVPEIEGVVNAEEVAAPEQQQQAGGVPPPASEQVPLPLPLAPPEPAPVILEHGIPHIMAHEPIPQPMPQPVSHPGVEAMAMLPLPEPGEEITITDQDVLFGRGGLTNRHIGNLRYRDIISIHRQDYVRAQKTEKPNVARRIVKAIRTGKNPGRFLRKGEDNRWHAVSDKEAAWKASQALREKSRWSSMKLQDREGEEDSPGATDAAVQKVLDRANVKMEKSPRKRKADDNGNQGQEVKKEKTGFASVVPQPTPGMFAADTLIPMEIAQITVPPVDTVGERKVGANYMLPATMNTNSGDIFPRDEDCLFGRGGRTNHHPGNKRLREIVLKYRDTYNQAKKVDKPKVSRLIVRALRGANPPSRFLRMNDETARWEEVDDKRAAEKVSQTLREKDRDAKEEYLERKTQIQKEEEEARNAVLQAAAQAASEVPVPGEMKMPHVDPEEMKMEEIKMPHVEGVVEIPLPSQLPLPSPEKGTLIGESIDI